MSSSIPVSNYVGILQEKCFEAKVNLPEYIEGDTQDNNFLYQCRIKHLTAEGIGLNKKAAKQNAAKAMLEKVEIEEICQAKTSTNETLNNMVSKLNIYCVHEKKKRPLYGELPEEDGDFVISCSFEGFTGHGKGTTKKIAKEKAAKAVSEHFNLFEYFDHMTKLKERNDSLKNSISQLHEYCQTKKLSLNFNERTSHSESKTPVFIVTCTVGEIQVESVGNSSKKLAKVDSAAKMLRLLIDTPRSSPDVGLSPAKCSRSSDLDNVSLVKRIKLDI